MPLSMAWNKWRNKDLQNPSKNSICSALVRNYLFGSLNSKSQCFINIILLGSHVLLFYFFFKDKHKSSLNFLCHQADCRRIVTACKYYTEWLCMKVHDGFHESAWKNVNCGHFCSVLFTENAYFALKGYERLRQAWYAMQWLSNK